MIFFVLFPITNVRDHNLFCASHFGSYRVNVRIEGTSSHNTLTKLSYWIKVTVTGFMFVPLPQINFIRQLLKLFDNIWKILHTYIINFIPFPLISLWPYNGLATRRGNQPLSWSTQIIFRIWRCDFIFVHTTKFQQDVQGDVNLTILDLPVLPNISKNTLFHVHRCASPSVNFSSHDVFQVEQPWKIDYGITTAKIFMLMTSV